MEGATDRDLILAAFLFGARIGRREAVGTMLHGYGLPVTPDIIDKLNGYESRLTLGGGGERFAPITNLEVSSDIHDKLLGKNPRILFVAQLIEVTVEDLIERYELTTEEVEAVQQAFEFANWRLRPSPPLSS